jgi:pimeloyl-ACP methyl ester carboxylesterase
MTIVFVHGVPETAAIWDDLRAQIRGHDTVALSPPGFGAPVPDGFACTSDAYLDWLITQIAALPGPVDLVGHDWGGGHVMRLAMSRPDLIRSWVSDAAGVFDPAYVWHDLAQEWQTPDLGEAAIAKAHAIPATKRAEIYTRLGMTPTAARTVCDAFDTAMGNAILALYRSARQPALAMLGQDLPTAAVRPGLVLIPTEDNYTGGEPLARRSAERSGAQVALLPGLGHWWMCENPRQGAETLGRFLRSIS